MSEKKTRQLAAIMFTDIVGYTKLMQKSESTAVQIRQRHREVFEAVTKKYDGQIIQYYGDGTLSIFNSTVKAVQCAAELQKQFLQKPAVPLRIGLHTGDIILTEADIIGDSVNVASRIESLGIAGTVLISRKVAEEIKNQDDLPVKSIGAFHFKNVEQPMAIYALALPGLVIPKAGQLSGKVEKVQKPKGIRGFKISKLNVALLLTLAIFILFSVWFFERQSKIRWATYVALPEVEELFYTFDYPATYRLAKEAEKYIPENEKLQELISLVLVNINVTTEPEAANVYVKEYKHPEEEWTYLGMTPLDSVPIPKATTFRWKIEKEGYETVYAVEPTSAFSGNYDVLTPDAFAPNHFHRVLNAEGSIPPGMTRVSGGEYDVGRFGYFFVDRFEVTNNQYKNFVTHGGYQNQSLWKYDFIDNGQAISWQEAMSLFVDQTGQPGPSNWEAGDFPEGHEDHPVGGISWYEAAAYAEYIGKSLPTGWHWWLARRNINLSLLAPFSNYNQKGSVPVGSLPGVTMYGAYDMGGNVREWCWNETSEGRLLRGGGWNNNTYSFGNLDQAPALDRSPSNGLRCVIYPEPDSFPKAVLEKIPIQQGGNYDLEPVSEEIFEVYRENYAYDKKDQHPEVLYSDDSYDDWVEEKVIFDAAYGNEKVSGYLFLPKSSIPPYQVVIYWPGSGSVSMTSSENLTKYYEFPAFLDFIVKTGRAVFYPVYQGTFERSKASFTRIHLGNETHESTEYLTMVVKDFRTSIDYLESRDDIDSSKIAFCGMSWGGVIGPIASAVEDRIKTNIYIVGGLWGNKPRPEVFPLNFLPRVKAPTLMLNGRYDATIPLETSAMPMYNLLGCPKDDKKLVVFESGHFPPRNEMIKEILAWLNIHLGQVKRLAM